MTIDFARLNSRTKIESLPGRRTAGATKTRAGAEKIKEPGDEPGLIHGIQAGSIPEWNVARALWKLGQEFDYQKPILGGNDVRGGMILDFLVHTVPIWTPLPVHGRHWHVEADQAFESAELVRGLRRAGYEVRQPVIVWEENAETLEIAYQFLFMKIGRG